jgi:hypothetical protein
VVKKLDTFARECREGKRRSTVVSTQSVDPLSINDRQIWNTIRKELKDIGISVKAFNHNKQFIFEWFEKALKNGAFDEQGPSDAESRSLRESYDACPVSHLMQSLKF